MTHIDQLRFLNGQSPLRDKMVHAHQTVQAVFPFIARIAVALYDPATRVLKTYLHSSGDADPLTNYQTGIDDAPSLKRLLEQGHPRVINNMLTFEAGDHEHTHRIGREGYRASYTLPLFQQGNPLGFLFFNSREADVFTEDVLRQLDVYGHLIALVVINELSAVNTLAAAVKSTQHITHRRDPETGSHLDRMSRYARLICRTIADDYDLDDHYVEHVFMFAPLHDIGKVAIPDSILRKPARLTDAERKVMESHTTKGRDMVDDLIASFGLDGVEHIDVLRNIAAYHHEAVNGTGYPEGRSGGDIPLEARIVAVADVFDALTSRRVYKAAWSNEDAFRWLREHAGEKLDAACVDALIEHADEVEAIQARFIEDRAG